MLKHFPYILCSILFAQCYYLSAQQTDYPIYTSIKYGNGFILPHHPEMKTIIIGHPSFYELDLAFSTFGKYEWQRRYNYLKIGLLTSAIDYKNAAVIGKSFQSCGYIAFPLIKTPRHLVYAKTAWGIAYITKVFNHQNNYKNNVIGTHFNIATQAILQYQLRLTPRFSWNGNLNFYHISNGAIKNPNNGFNILAASTGITYELGNSMPLLEQDSIFPPYDPFWESEIRMFLGAKEVYPIESGKNIAGSIGYSMTRNLNYKSAVQFGVELFYNGGNVKTILNDYPNVSKLSAAQLGIPVGYILKIDRFSAGIFLGIYAYDKYLISGRFYNRLGMQYRFKNNLKIYYYLKTHKTTADYLEFGLGYNFRKK